MLNIANLYFDYLDKLLLNNVNLSLEEGSFLHLKGNNGAGKTTLLKLIAGLLSPRQGTIRFNGQNIEHDLTAYQQNLCYLGHKNGFSPVLTVRENCQFDLHHYGYAVDECLDKLGLLNLADKPCTSLSAGQRRRVGLIRLVMTSARLWLLDEPFTALDKKGMNDLSGLLMAHLQRGGMAVVTSHQPLPDFVFSVQEYDL